MYIFDLDLTVWSCFNRYENPIWAKQLIPPFEGHIEGTIIDDVGSQCILKKGIFNYLESLQKQNKKIGFCSIGAYKNLSMELQPSILLLKKFNLYKFFNGPKILEYKIEKKKELLKSINEKSFFFDDNDKFIKSVSELNNFSVFDAKKIKNWNDLIDKI